MADFSITNEGPIVLFRALTPAALEHAEEAFADAMTFGTAYAVEHRYAYDIVGDLMRRGFEVAYS